MDWEVYIECLMGSAFLLDFLVLGTYGQFPCLATQRKTQGNTSTNIQFLRFFDAFLKFSARFWGSWRPGNLLKGFLEVVRFFCTDCGPVGMHGDPNRMYFHDRLVDLQGGD